MVAGMDGEGAGPKRAGWRRRPRKAVWIPLAVLLVLALIGGGLFWLVVGRYVGDVQRIPDAFAGIEEERRPPKEVGIDTMTFLFIGTDTDVAGHTTGGDATGGAAADSGGGSRSDAIMLVQVRAGGEHATVISIPRDSWVPVAGHGPNKINAAYAYGGAPLLIETVENLTGVRIDHFAAIDFEGFKAITDALGGVTVDVATETTSRGVTFVPGPNRLDGASALIYVRQRYDLPGSDFDRVLRQQAFLRAVLLELRGRNLLGSPVGSDKIVRAVTGSVSVDDSLGDFDLLGLARQLARLGAEDVDFLTAPVAGTGWEGEQNVVYLDDAALATMMTRLRDGSLSAHVADYTVLPQTPN